ncbi:Glycosyl hydrolases family 43 [Paenibacillus sp. UNCCL117]|uniref:glycoside hydrolase family 43 protein n=1 Tax=unclassified Paenibacillus TaxID=185978 RepID=UPI00088CC90C|nr:MULTISPECIES: glycoside hydrolase family 43 protein [unclassified Paenibacillus]SDD58531.1 Glycosyl hydrolases family 43 [Paenibacillus sp. cl123]SFW50998.1 Glycosyl hydrolases family 43 [Paenibacillus sp. UNCCL117]
MIPNSELQIRDPFVLPMQSEGKYYLFGSTDANIWGKGTGFDMYVGEDLENWEGPYPVFRPRDDFYSDTNFWAPEVYAYDGRWYMFATFRRKDNGLLGTAVLVSDSLKGPFEPHSSGPVTPAGWSSLDGTLFVDEAGGPWMVFCHEWQQIGDGQVCAVRLSADLREAVGEPVVLFSASEAPWTTSFYAVKYPDQENYVTDGPFLIRGEDGCLLMLWASFIDNRYALGVARSAGGSVLGPWVHEPAALYRNDGGHAMVFRAFDGRLMLSIHTPNKTPYERPLFLELEPNGDNSTAWRLAGSAENAAGASRRRHSF